MRCSVQLPEACSLVEEMPAGSGFAWDLRRYLKLVKETRF